MAHELPVRNDREPDFDPHVNGFDGAQSDAGGSIGRGLLDINLGLTPHSKLSTRMAKPYKKKILIVNERHSTNRLTIQQKLRKMKA